MSKLANNVQSVGLCSNCGNQPVNSITLLEAQKAIEIVKEACIEAVAMVDVNNDTCSEVIFKNDAIQAIRNIK